MLGGCLRDPSFFMAFSWLANVVNQSKVLAEHLKGLDLDLAIRALVNHSFTHSFTLVVGRRLFRLRRLTAAKAPCTWSIFQLLELLASHGECEVCVLF